MKYKVSISDRSYEVEIEDIHARPIIAYVDGQKFEVHPENGSKPEVTGGSDRIQTGLLPPHSLASKQEAEMN